MEAVCCVRVVWGHRCDSIGVVGSVVHFRDGMIAMVRGDGKIIGLTDWATLPEGRISMHLPGCEMQE